MIDNLLSKVGFHQAHFVEHLESRLEGVDRRKLKFTTLNTLQDRVSVRIKSESEREGKTNQPRK